ncbi:FGGY-family carbohydrate kinase [Caldibacillus thermoamylovorans]|uniref:FGGY-family carbohydrate kinase n=1 Tax=Caldibacillus thermoamylovorans TaxID=35841 RepID=UPI0022E76DB9|nr:FGGY family carbohydrate kinase [Caldibacillus thermoamylovorans]
MYIIGIDIGTTNTKLLLIDISRFVLIEKYNFPTYKIQNGSETDFDIQKIWENIKIGIKHICNKDKIDGELLGISIASVGEAGVLINKDNKIIGPAISWYDKRGNQYIDKLTKQLSPEAIYQITGLSPHSNYSIGKIKWILEKYPEVNPNEITWLNLANYIAFKLTNNKYLEYSLVSRTLAYDLSNEKWSNEILQSLNINQSIFPPIKHSGESIGKITNELAKEFNIPDTTLVSVAGHDHMIGSLITNLKEGEEILNSTGTTEGLLLVQRKPCFSANSFNYNLSNGKYVKWGLYSYFGSIPAAGFSVEWLRKLLNISEKEFFDNKMNDLFQKYNSGYFDNKKIIFIPQLRGSGPPKRLSNSKSLIYGFDEHTNESDIIFSLFLGMCFELKNLLSAFKDVTNTNPKLLKVIGSAIKNDFWLQLKSDVLGCEIKAYNVDEPVAMGAVLSMGMANKWVDNNNIVKDSEIKIFSPNKERTLYFDELFDKCYKSFLNFKYEYEN